MKERSVKRFVTHSMVGVLLLAPLLGWAQGFPERWRQLTPGEKERVWQNYERWRALPPKEKEHLEEEWDRWRSLPQDRRDELIRRFDELRRLSPEEERKLRDRLRGDRGGRPKARGR